MCVWPSRPCGGGGRTLLRTVEETSGGEAPWAEPLARTPRVFGRREVLGRPLRLQEALRSSKRFPGPGDPRFSLRGRSVLSARGASMSEKFPKALEIAILVTFIFKKQNKKCLERSKIHKRNCSMIPCISCRSTQSSREAGPGERLIEGKGFLWGMKKSWN